MREATGLKNVDGPALPYRHHSARTMIAFAAMANRRVTPSSTKSKQVVSNKNKVAAKAAKARPPPKAAKAQPAAKAQQAKAAKAKGTVAKATPKASPPEKVKQPKSPAKVAKAGGGNGPARITSRHFGAIASEMETTVERRGESLLVDVNLADPSAFTQAAVDSLDRAVDEIEHRDVAARAAFAAAMSDDQTQPVLFWRFHRDEVEGHEDLGRDTFAATLRLVRVGFYPDGAFDTASYIVLDFAVPGPQTDQLLVAKFLPDGSLSKIAWES